jgi:hypothetical protein
MENFSRTKNINDTTSYRNGKVPNEVNNRFKCISVNFQQTRQVLLIIL